MRKILTSLFLLSFLLCLTACSPSGTKGNGEIGSSMRTVATFQKVDVSGELNVLVTVNRPQRVIVTADSNLLDDIVTEVSNDTLYISLKKDVRINPTVTPSIAVYVNQLQAVHTAGAVKLNVSNLKADSFFVQTEGSSNVNLRGETKELTITSAGAAKVEAMPLETENAAVNINGAATVRVHATKNLKIKINGAGVVEYTGDPEIDQQVEGIGRILKIK